MRWQETWTILLAGAVSAAIAAGIAWFVRKRESEPEDVTIGFLGPSLAAMYLLVLALALATEWSTIGSAQQAVGNEAVAVRQIYWAAAGLPKPAASNLETQVDAYLGTVIHHDWPQMQRGTLDDRSDQQLTAMSTFVLRLDETAPGASNAPQYAIAQLSALASARAQRANAAESRLPLGVLVAVLVTSLIVCLFPFVGGMKSDKANVVIAILQTGLVAVTAMVVFQLDNPFTGPLATTPDPLTAVAALVGVR
jgi:amino acid transporter